MLSAETAKTLMGWEPVNARLITARFYGTATTISIVQGYAPTNDAEPEEKVEFYDTLQSIIDKIPKKDLLIIMGDFNAKIGSDNTGREGVMGRHGEGEINLNGELFVEMCAFNCMVIGGSIFPHKRIHKTTWMSPDHNTENQIDHICISKRFRRSVHDMRVGRGADVASDHHLVVATLRLKLRKYNTRNPKVAPRYNTKLLQDPPSLRAFQIALNNRYQVLADDEEQQSIAGVWNDRKQAWTDTSNEILGLRRNQHKEWITTETLSKIESRRKLKDKISNSRTRAARREAQKQYNKANQEVRRAIKYDKRQFINNLAKEAETAANQHRMKDLYELTRKLAGKRALHQSPSRTNTATRSPSRKAN